MSEYADACIAYLDERKLDITMLWLVQHWDWLDTFVFGKKLLSFIENTMKLKRAHVVRIGFHNRVTAVFCERGVQKLCPDRMVQAYYMEEVFNRCCRAKWEEPFLPFMLQMRPGVFVVFANWQDGFYWIQEKTWKRVHMFDGENLPVDMLYEKQIVGLGPHGDMPCQLIIDFDAYVDEFGGRLTVDELKKLMTTVLPWFVEKLVSIGAIAMDQTVVVVEKEKSRANTSKGPKVSRHYIFNLIGISVREHRAILRRIFLDKFTVERRKMKDSKSMAHVEIGSDACLALLGDAATMHGRNQFSILFCGKSGETPPKITNIYEISRAGQGVKVTPWEWAKDDHVPTHDHAMEMLFHACYSCMNPKTVTLKPNFFISLVDTGVQAKKRPLEGSSAEPSTLSLKTGRSVGRGFLPPWVESAVGRGDYGLNTTMQCLEAKYNKLKEHVPDVKREDVGHVIAVIPCPIQALCGKVQVHAKNGVFVAKAGVDVYAMCANCSLCGEVDKKKSLASIVEGMEMSRCPWVRYTEDAFTKMLRISKKSSA